MSTSLLELQKQQLELQKKIVAAMEGDKTAANFAAEVKKMKAAKAERLDKFASAIVQVNKAKITDSLTAGGFVRGANNEATGYSTWGRKSDGVALTIKDGKFTALNADKHLIIKDEPAANIPGFISVLKKKK